MSNPRNLSSFTLIVTFVCLSLIGVVLVPLLPVKLAPSRTLPGLTVSFSMPGNSSRVIEAEVTSKLEAMMARVKGIRKVNSTSDNGSGSISLELDKHADIDVTRFEVSTIIRQTWPQLPEGVSYPQISTRRSDDKASRPFITYTLNAPANPILIQQYAEENIKPVLGQLKGIYKVELNGATPMEWQLEYDSDQLSRLGITLQAVQRAINRHYEKEFLGICSIEKGAEGREWIRLVRTSTEKEMEFEPGAIQLQAEDGTMVTLDKLIKVRHVEERPQSYYRINGLNSVYLYITAEETANQLNLSGEVKHLMGELQQKMPPGYEVHISYDATEYIQKELDKIYFRTGLTVLILLLFVALITRNLRYLFLIVTSLAVNISVAVILYYAFGLEMQLYSLAGITISLNLVIDNTIVMTDHILHRRNLKAFVSVLAATLTTIGALVIIFFLDEKIRLNLQDFAAVVIINLAVSLFVALFFVPSMIDKIGLEKKKRRKRRRFLLRPTFMKRLTVYFTRFYQGVIYYLCRFRVIACLLLLLGFGVPVSYPFGYGQSYTTFNYSSLKVFMGDTDYSISCTITNNGPVAGKEVVQLYISAPGKSMDKPAKELRGFAKTQLLQPGESREIIFKVKDTDLASFDESASHWVVESGKYEAQIGSSAADIRLRDSFNVKGRVTEKVHAVLLPSERIDLLKR